MSQTLRKITYDILEIVRGANVSQSEQISIRQVEEWVAEYRALLIKQSVDKGYPLSQILIQSIDCMELDLVDKSECCNLGIDTCDVLRTKLTVPKMVKSNITGDLLLFAGTVQGKPYQIVSEQRASWYQYRKFTSKDIYVFMKNNYIYVIGTSTLERLTIRGVFENPMDLMGYTNGCTNQVCYNVDNEYPITRDMLPGLKQLILKNELNIMVTLPSDHTNNASNKVQSNLEK